MKYNLNDVTVNDAVVWEQTDVSATQTTARLAGGAMTATASYTSEGLLSGLNTSMGSGIAGTLRNYTYSFNSATGNLESRSFTNRLTPTAVTETFVYDNLYRLTAADTMLMTYQPNGNVDTKTGLGQYTYGGNGAGPHAVTSVANSAWRSGQEIEYNVFNRATTIIDTLGGRRYRLDITCGPGRERVKTELLENGILKKAVIFNGNYERITRQDTVTHLYYVGGGDGLCGIYVKQTKGVAILRDGMYYVHTDHLGSLAVITDAAGNIVQQATFDVWGVRTFTVKDPTLVFDRGFTGHEHLDEFGLINMNARLYDPVLGRFLSPDPFVQMPDYSQSYNRYSYALNNPLIYTDPSGELIGELLFTLASMYYTGVSTNFFSSSNPFNPGQWNWKNPWTYINIAASGVSAYMQSTTFGAATSNASTPNIDNNSSLPWPSEYLLASTQGGGTKNPPIAKFLPTVEVIANRTKNAEFAQWPSLLLNNAPGWITLFKAGVRQQTPLLNFTHTTVGALTYTMTSSFMGGMVTNGLTTNMVRGVAAPGRIQIGQSFDKLGTVVKNPGLSITNFSKHGLNQTITRGVNPSTILNTVKNPVTVLQQSGGNYLHLTREAAVVINPTGRVVSTYPASMFDSSILNVLKGL